MALFSLALPKNLIPKQKKKKTKEFSKHFI